ncbi:MAG: hypothetical protein CUN55_20280, partial [Phototrophicales bacterium]
MADFDIDKREVLSVLGTPDASRKGCVDEAIMPLLSAINSLAHHYTTSSCAGRFLLIGLTADRKKHNATWLYVSHDTVAGDDLLSALVDLDSSIKEVWFHCESPILHVCSRTLEDATWL